MVKLLRATLESLDTLDLHAIAEILRGGGVAILPTDTIYGFHAMATHQRAVERIFEIKERGPAKPLVVIAESIEQAHGLGVRFDDGVEPTLRAIWPAPLTAILPLERPIAASAGAMTLAVRVPALDWLRRLLSQTGCLATTSVNRTAEPPLVAIDALPVSFAREVDGILDAGAIDGRASTLVDFTISPPRVIREGDFRFAQDLWKTPRKTL
jgi:tRNA threonylcarbamoyl adenosine modification protein (Sua5/YciO/YrdC/YwlC family)